MSTCDQSKIIIRAKLLNKFIINDFLITNEIEPTSLLSNSCNSNKPAVIQLIQLM